MTHNLRSQPYENCSNTVHGKPMSLKQVLTELCVLSVRDW